MFYGELVAICIKGKSLFCAHSSFPPFSYGAGAPSGLYRDGEGVRSIFSGEAIDAKGFQGAPYALQG